MASLAEQEEGIALAEFDELPPPVTQPGQVNRRRQSKCQRCRGQLRKHKKLILVLLYLAYFSYAVLRCIWQDCPEDDERWTLILLTCVGTLIAVFNVFFIKICWPPLKQNLLKVFSSCLPLTHNKVNYAKWSLYFGLLIAYISFVLVDCIYLRNDPQALISLAGVFVLLFLCSLASIKFRRKAPLRLQPTVIGMTLQFVIALIILRSEYGYLFFTHVAYIPQKFFEYANEGAKYVWTTAFNSRDLAFSVLPIIPFFAAFTSMLGFFGWWEGLIKFLATAMEKLMGTTAAESIVCCANVFVGMAESPFLIYRFLPYMTMSELHAMMTGGFATIAVYMFGALSTEQGIDVKHLLTASLMAGPGALALSKLVYPEINHTNMKAKDIFMYTPPRKNRSPKSAMEALYDGAGLSISVVAHIAVNLIAIISTKSLINAVLKWFGARAGLGFTHGASENATDSNFGLELIASYVFFPIAYLIGAPLGDCRAVAGLLGIRLFANDPFSPFASLSVLANNRLDYEQYYCRYPDDPPVQLANGSILLPAVNSTITRMISKRGQDISTYALCGYANLAAAGIQIGALGALSPSARPMVASLAFRTLFTATAVNLMNAATAGILLDYNQPSWNETCSNFLFNQSIVEI